VTPTPAARRSIRRVLVANRGEIAVRIIEAAHQLGISTVAVFAEPDRDARHVHEADTAVALDGTTAGETYLDQAKLLEAALTQGCDAVHPGYGFLSERADFARAVVDAGLTWIGPHPEAIATMGDKLAAKAVAARVGVPMLASAALTGDAEFEWRAQAAAVGYPLLIKSAAGGGGRGMRLVGAEDELADAVPAARREAESSFGDGTVFAERWLAAPRHIEIQIVADRHGNVIHLGERECSIQRRHQKLIEEAPSPVVDEMLREQLGLAAIELARAIDYDNVGTVEFLLDEATGEFAFLEMNTRIQVEHRVTEEATGCDLVWWQFQCARGEPLDWAQDDVDLDTHAVEVRLYAEDPALDWLPATGTLAHLDDDPVDEFVLVDSGVDDGAVVTTHFDPLIAKVIARGYTREVAIGRLARFLRDLELHGVVTNRDYLLGVLEHPDFLEGRTTTLFVADHPLLLDAGPDLEAVVTHALAAAVRRAHDERRHGPWPFAPTGWRVTGRAAQADGFTYRGNDVDVTWTLAPDGAIHAESDGVVVDGRVLEHHDRHLLLEVDGVARCYWINRIDDTWYVNSSLGQTDLVERPRLPRPTVAATAGGPTAPVPGRVVAVAVAVGDVVEPGHTLAVLEAMKVEHPIIAQTGAVVAEVLVAPGDTVDAHQLLIRLEETP